MKKGIQIYLFFCICLIMSLCIGIFGYGAAEQKDDIRNMLDNATFFTDSHDSFTVPLMTDDGWENDKIYKTAYGRYSSYTSKDTDIVVMNEFLISQVSEFYENGENVQKYYAGAGIDGRDIAKESIQIDGRPAVIATYDQYDTNGFSAHCGVLLYVRQNRLLKVQLYTKLSAKKRRSQTG